MRRLIVEAFRADGYEVQEASDGGRLLVQLTHGPRCDYEQVDLIVSDVRMPICTGIQVIEALRAARCFVPVILMTAFGDRQTRGRAELLGAVLFDKPFAIGDLRAAAADALAPQDGVLSPPMPSRSSHR
jgi:putative two-component system response regulator